MLIDLRSLPEGFRLDCDLCIVGAGPAGLAVASMAAEGGRKVAILESGGRDAEPESADLAAGELRGDWHYPLETIRARQLGGSAGRFGIRSSDGKMGWRSGPLDPIDFETRSWVPESGWPFSRETLDPWYARAHELSGFGAFDYNPATWATEECKPLATDGSPIVSTLWHWGPQEIFTSKLPGELAARPNVDVYTHATTTELISAPDSLGKITSAKLRCIDGPSGSVSASNFVLAGGGIDNPRLLLLSQVGQPGSAGNSCSMVGKGFMEHQFVRAGTWYPSDRRWVVQAGFYDLRKVRDSNIFGRFALSEDFQRKQSLLNASALLIPRHARYLPDSVESLRTLLGSARKGQLPPDIGDHLRTAASGADFIALNALRKVVTGGRLQPRPRESVHLFHGAGWSLDPDRAERYSAFDLYLHGEQAPDFENRVELGEKRDSFGSRRAALHWHWDDLSRESLMRWGRCFAEAISNAGLGTVKLDVVRGRPRFMIDGCCHHMGTTRMHDSPRLGVVDRNCRVHGTENLYVAGSSVFPTGGEVNATLTVVALAARLGTHLQ